MQFDNQAIPFSEPAANYFESFLTYFNKLMETYQKRRIG